MRTSYKTDSPLGPIRMTADERGLTGLWFEDRHHHEDQTEDRMVPVFEETKRWLKMYFNGEKPDFTPSLHLMGTAFQKEVWDILSGIPYGKTMTYKEIAQIVAERRGIPKMSAQAVGQAVGHNPVSIIVPCHRVIGTNGNLTGYAGGLEKKIALLETEKVDPDTYKKSI